MSRSNSESSTKLNRRQALLLSATAGVAALAGTSCGSGGGTNTAAPQAPAASCSTPRTAVANTQYGKVRGYVEDGVLTFKGVPYGANTGGENRWLPAKPPTPWEGEYPALTYGPNCPQHLHDWSSEQTFLQQWTDGWLERGHAQGEHLDAQPDGQTPGDVLHSWRRLFLRLGLRTRLAGRGADGPASRRRVRDGQSPSQHPRILRRVLDRRVGVCRFGQRRDDRPGGGASLGSGQHRQFRRRSGLRHDLRPVGRRLQGDHAAGDALGGGTDSSRVGAVGRWRRCSQRRAVQRVCQARYRRARRQGYRRAPEDGMGQVERDRQCRRGEDEPADGRVRADCPSGNRKTARGLGTDRRRPRHYHEVLLRRRSRDIEEHTDADRLGERRGEFHAFPADGGGVAGQLLQRAMAKPRLRR